MSRASPSPTKSAEPRRPRRPRAPRGLANGEASRLPPRSRPRSRLGSGPSAAMSRGRLFHGRGRLQRGTPAARPRTRPSSRSDRKDPSPAPARRRRRARGSTAPPLEHARGRLVHVLQRDGDEAVALERRPRRSAARRARSRGSRRPTRARPALRSPARRDVVRRADHGAGLRDALVDVHGACDPEVGHLRAPVAVHDHVLRLHVAVDEPLLVRECERLADVDRELEGLVDRQRAAPLEDPSG